MRVKEHQSKLNKKLTVEASPDAVKSPESKQAKIETVIRPSTNPVSKKKVQADESDAPIPTPKMLVETSRESFRNTSQIESLLLDETEADYKALINPRKSSWWRS